MTIKFIADYPPYKIGNIVTLTSAEETALVGQKVAVTDLTGGVPYVPETPSTLSSLVKQLLSGPQAARTDITGVMASTESGEHVGPDGIKYWPAKVSKDPSGNVTAILNGDDSVVNLQMLIGRYAVNLNSFYSAIANTDTLAINAALDYCKANGVDLNIDARLTPYEITGRINYNPRAHSIKGFGKTKFNLANYSGAGSVFNLTPDLDSAGNLWESITHSISGITFEANENCDLFTFEGTSTAKVPALNIKYCLFNKLRKTAILKSNSWCIDFERCMFRDGGEHFEVDKPASANAGENITFTRCLFSGGDGALTTTALSLVSGTVEIKYIACSFDYLAKTLNYTPTGANASRVKIVYQGTHHEDDGTKQFYVNSQAAAFNIDFISSDWWYNSTKPLTIGTFESTNSNARVNLFNCQLPIYTVTAGQERSLSNLFEVPAGSKVLVRAKNTTIEDAGNTFKNKMSNALNLIPLMLSSEVGGTSAISNPVWTTSGTGTIATDADKPASVTTETWKITGDLSASVVVPYEDGQTLNILGWMNRSANTYTFKVEFYTAGMTLISSLSPGFSGTLNTWVKFGQAFGRGFANNVPVGTRFVKVIISSAASAGGATCKFNDLHAEVI